MSNKPRKVRRDSKLKNLPEDQRKLISDWVSQDGAHSCLQRMRSELGISSNQASLYEALAFWRSEQRFTKFESLARAQAEHESNAAGGMSADEMQEAVDRNFIMLAAETEDTELYKELRLLRIRDMEAKGKAKTDQAKVRQKDAQIRQKDRDLTLAERRVKLLEDNANKAKEQLEAVKKTGGLSAEALRQIEEAAALL